MNDFPILKRKVHNKRLVYLDNAATSQKPLTVIKVMKDYYVKHNANIHRGLHTLAEEATEMYETARAKVAGLINCSPEEIVFTRNTTESINLVAYSLGSTLEKGDEVISTVMEHHSNIVPWQNLRGISAKFVDITDEGELKIDDYDRLLSRKTKIITVTHASNVLGTINPVREICRIAHDAGSVALVDAAQSVPHMPVDVKEIDCDFMAFSGHKMLGPTGIGVLYGKRELLQEMPPFLTGGGMIREVSLSGTSWNEVPAKFEAGTPDIGGAVGLGAAVDYLRKIGMEKILQHEQELARYALERLKLPGVRVFGPTDSTKKVGVVAFNVKGIHPHDLSALLDMEGIAIRGGHHCAMPLMNRLHLAAVARASFAPYNQKRDIDALIKGIKKAQRVFAK